MRTKYQKSAWHPCYLVAALPASEDRQTTQKYNMMETSNEAMVA
jgi:hypothetical protein